MQDGRGQVISWYICTIISVLFLGARLGARLHTFGRLFVDDGFLILAACCLIGDLVIQQHMWNLGMASIPNVSRENLIGIMKMIIPGSILYITSLWAIKVALVLFYKKLAAPGTRLQLIYSITLGFLGVSWAVVFFDNIFQCWPESRKWAENPSEQCSKKASDVNYWITILLNIFSDVLIISLPISMVLKLQMPLKQKVGVAAIFALGFFVVIASIIRAYYSKRNETMLTCTVSMVETAVAIIATSLPALRTLFIGHTSRVGTGSASHGRHYELSSHNRSKANSRNTLNGSTAYSGGMSKKASDSEDELVADGMSGQTRVVDAYCEGPRLGNRKDGITVLSEFQVTDEASGTKRGTGIGSAV